MSEQIRYVPLVGKTVISERHALLFVAAGEAEITANNATRVAKSGTLVLFSPKERAKVSPKGEAVLHLVALHLSLTAHPFFAPLFAPFEAEVRERALTEEEIAFFDTVMGDMAALPSDSPAAQQRLFAKLVELLASISSLTPDGAERAPRAHGKIAPAVLAFVDAHVGEAISLDDIASALFISKYHMSHVFKRETGLSVGEAVLRRKVEHADALLASGLPAHRVCELVGFNHYSAFFRIYKRIKGHSPKG